MAPLSCRLSSAAAPARFDRRGEFRVLLPSAPVSLNPNIALDEISLVTGRNIFNHLISLNEGGRLVPELAASWTTSPDGLTYTFTLHEAVQWHDGTPFSSADVQWTLETVARDGFAREALAPMAAVAAPDPHTVIITLKHAWAPFAADLAGAGFSILPRHIYQGTDWKTNPANERPVGTGPFRFARRPDASTLVLEANDNYFRSGPYVERVIFKAVDPDAVMDLLLRGEADYSVGRPAALNPLAPAPEPLQIRTLPTSSRYYIGMNLRRKPFDNLHVRRALVSAIDRLKIVRDALGGLGAPAVGWYTPDVEWAYNAAARVPDFDLAAAGRMLDAVGLRQSNGERFRATLLVPNIPPMREIADALQQQLAVLGVRLDVQRVPSFEWTHRVTNTRDFELTLMSGTQGPDPDQLRRRFLASGDASGAYIGYESADFRDAVERGARVVDLSERAVAYRRAQEILARDVPFIPLAETVKVVVYNARVSGLPQLEARGLVGTFDFSLVKLRAAGAVVSQ
jgi:peptide/nickel transport system substrate-binding protein